MADQFSNLLSDYLDGEDLAEAERARIERHLGTCVECRETLEELRAVAAHAARLPASAPPQDLWPGVAARIASSDAISPSRVWWAPLVRRVSFTVPQLAAAALALMVLSGGTVWLARQGGARTDFEPLAAAVATEPAQGPGVTPARSVRTADGASDAGYDAAVADLQHTIELGRGRLDPQTMAVLDANLRTIDEAIEQCRRAVAADPASVYLNTHLASAQRRKLLLLRRASALATARS